MFPTETSLCPLGAPVMQQPGKRCFILMTGKVESVKQDSASVWGSGGGGVGCQEEKEGKRERERECHCSSDAVPPATRLQIKQSGVAAGTAP